MDNYVAWFRSEDGPYPVEMEADDSDEIADLFANDPHFICAVPADDDYEPVAEIELTQ